eukprot:tig00021126_g18461.t1
MRPATFIFAVVVLAAVFTTVRADTAAKVENAINPERVGLQTDATTVQREEDKIVSDGFSVKDAKNIKATAEKFEFQAEVNRLMDIIINSLYSKKEIFLRELISNASDALDKIRFMSLTNSTALGEGETAKLEIKISADKDKKILSIQDRGIGMTKKDLINNLGTIAKSGTMKFLESAGNSTDLNLIGQFGVGFYSVYLVADYVTVVSKHNDDNQYIWESRADSSYTITEDPEGPTLGRGTKIMLHLKEDANEYIQEDKLKELVKRYSEFINFPIYLHTSKEVEVEVPDEEAEKEAEEKKEEADTEKKEGDEEKKEGDEEKKDEEEAEVSDVDEEKKPKTKKVKETKWEWTQLNDVKAIWTRDPKDITEEEYTNFYKTVSKNFDEPLGHIHFKAEGEVEFKALLFLPGRAPADLFDNYNEKSTALKLFVRRVFITDEFDDLMPKYLKFITGIVDSDDLPLNVSREMLQQHKMLKVIKKKLVRKVLELIKQMSDKAEKARKKELEKDDEKAEEPAKTEEETKKEEEEEEEKDDKDPQEQYKKLYEAFGKNLKLGVVEDQANRNRLAKMLRFYSSKSNGTMISFNEYIGRMKPKQDVIYYIAGESLDAVKHAPFLERLVKKDLEVLYLVDPIDEYAVQHMPEYEMDKETKYKLVSATKEGLKIAGEDEKEKAREKKMKEEFKGFSDWVKELLGSRVEKVALSKRLAKSPAILVTGQYGWSANMERIMKAQALNDPSRYNYMISKKTLEINPYHPMVRKLNELSKTDKEDPLAKELATVLYDTAALNSGFAIEDPNNFADRIYRLMKRGLSMDPDAAVDEEEVAKDEAAAAEEEEEEEKKVDDGMGDAEAAPADDDQKEAKPAHDEL